MSARRVIKDGVLFEVLGRGIVYIKVLGCVDMGHARGNNVPDVKYTKGGTSLSLLGAKQ